tara:strand:+ start:139 stop:489 length:351 start_codon:yes stop_codon:yes gene_type:complete
MKKEIKVNKNIYESPQDLIECFDDDVCNLMGNYVNMESFFDKKRYEEKFNYYINGLKGLILDTHKVKWEHTTKISGNGEEYQSIEIIEDDEIKLAEDNAKADLEAQDYDVFGENKI